MSKKLLKNVDWIISVPNKVDVEDKYVASTGILIKRNGKVTKWCLQHNFKDEGEEYFGAYLKLKSDKVDFDMELIFIVVDWIDANDSKIIKSEDEWKIDDWKKGEGWGKSNILSHEEIYSEQSRFVKDGKLHLIVVIKEKFRENQDEMNQMNGGQVDEVFKAITGSADDTTTITIEAAEGVLITALRSIITQKSPVFAAMLETDMVEKSRGVVKIVDFSGKVMEEMLRFIYFGKIESIEDVDMELHNAAKVYQVEFLGDVCLKSIESRVNLSNVFEILQFADLHNEDGLFDTCSEIICRYFDTPKIQEKIEEFECNVQNRLLRDLAIMSRYNNHVFCSVYKK